MTWLFVFLVGILLGRNSKRGYVKPRNRDKRGRYRR